MKHSKKSRKLIFVYYFNEALTIFVSRAPKEKSTSDNEREEFISLQQAKKDSP